MWHKQILSGISLYHLSGRRWPQDQQAILSELPSALGKRNVIPSPRGFHCGPSLILLIAPVPNSQPMLEIIQFKAETPKRLFLICKFGIQIKEWKLQVLRPFLSWLIFTKTLLLCCSISIKEDWGSMSVSTWYTEDFPWEIHNWKLALNVATLLRVGLN